MNGTLERVDFHILFITGKAGRLKVYKNVLIETFYADRNLILESLNFAVVSFAKKI